jgi:hypothetical protein
LAEVGKDGVGEFAGGGHFGGTGVEEGLIEAAGGGVAGADDGAGVGAFGEVGFRVQFQSGEGEFGGVGVAAPAAFGEDGTDFLFKEGKVGRGRRAGEEQ